MGWQIIKFNDMKIAIIGGSGFVGSRLIGLLQTVPNIELLNIDKQQSELYPHLTEIADVQDVQKLTELLAGTDLVVLLAAEHKDNVTPASLYYTVNVEGISNDENKTFGTIKFVAKSVAADQNNTVTIGADFQSSQDTSDVYLNWQNMNIEVANDGNTSTSTGSVTVKLGEHNRVTWNEVSYNTSNGIKKKLETAMNSNLTVNDETEFVTDDVFITKWSSLTVKNKWKTTNATFDLKQSSVNAKEMEIENRTMNGDSKLFTQKSCTVNKITSNDADELLLVAEKTADVVEWPMKKEYSAP